MNFTETLRVFRKDNKGFFPKGGDDEPGGGRTYAVNQAAAEKTFNTQKGCRCFQFAGNTVKLAALTGRNGRSGRTSRSPRSGKRYPGWSPQAVPYVTPNEFIIHNS